MKPELSKNRRSSRFSPEKRYFLIFLSCTLYFYMKFCTLLQNGNVWNVTVPDFRKTYFSGRKCRKYARKTGFLAFSQDFIISFFWFFAQRWVIIMYKIWSSSIFEKEFFPAENSGNMTEIAVFADFHWTFSLYLFVFSVKNITNNNAHH